MILAIIVIVVLLAIISVLFEKSNKKPEATKSEYHYKIKDFVMSRPEHELFDILIASFGDRYRVFPQIHLDHLVDEKVVGQNWKGAWRHIDEKSVDFVICDKAYLKPLLAIELDDHTHQREDRKTRDVEVERILKEAGLKLLRIQNTGSLNPSQIEQDVSRSLSNG